MADSLGKEPSPTTGIAWYVGHFFAAAPSAMVAALFQNASSPGMRLVLAAALAWCAGSIICTNTLGAWHWVTRSFSNLTLSMIGTIAAIVGAFAGLTAATIANTTGTAIVAFVAALLGSLQGAAIIWLVVGPDLQPPPTAAADAEIEDEAEENPDTRTP